VWARRGALRVLLIHERVVHDMSFTTRTDIELSRVILLFGDFSPCLLRLLFVLLLYLAKTACQVPDELPPA
jgi:hypothetical protein